MKTIHFINGETKKVSTEIAQLISQYIEKNCTKFQTFKDASGNLLFMLNIDHIVYID
jgi:hypothetical protein